MNRRAFLAAAGAMLGCPLPALADDELVTQVAALLSSRQVVRAQFVQTRHMSALKRPVVSSGHLTFSGDVGVLWRIEKPLALAYAITNDKVLETGADGVLRERKVPALQQVGRVMKSLLNGDIPALRQYFHITSTGTLREWSINLKPRQAQMAQVIEGLEIAGGQFVDLIRIREMSGDSTTMAFTGSRADASLTDEDRRLFGLGPR